MNTSAASGAPARAAPWRVLAFLAVFALLYTLYTSQPAAERWVIETLTVGLAAALLGAVAPGLGVAAEGARLSAPGGGLNVLEGCEGADLALLLASALLVAPLRWHWRLAGIAAGLAWVLLLNQARVLALFAAHRHARDSFDLLHTLLLPVLLVALTGLFAALWVRRFGAPPADATGATPAAAAADPAR